MLVRFFWHVKKMILPLAADSLSALNLPGALSHATAVKPAPFSADRPPTW